MKEIEIYTDGACSGNPGVGGWAAILIYKGKEKIISGAEANTTNNRMELMAVINSLKAIKQPCKINLFSDSAYVVNAINNNWLVLWENNNWKTAAKTPVANIDLWKELLILLNKYPITFIKVKGHADNEYNNRCDKLAVSEIQKYKSNKIT